MFEAGVRAYSEMYYEPGYEPAETEILAAFRITPQPGVPPEEAAAAVAAESSTGTWTSVWTDRLTDLDATRRASRADPGAGGQWLAYVAYPLDLFEARSPASPPRSPATSSASRRCARSGSKTCASPSRT